MQKAAAPKAILGLVEESDPNREACPAGGINELQLRREYIDPLFEALGWDVENRQGHAPAYRDAAFEDSLGLVVRTAIDVR